MLKESNTAIAPVNNVDEVLKDTQVLHDKMLAEFDHPVHGKVRQTGIPIQLLETPEGIRTLCAKVGAHTDEILKELDFGSEAISELYKLGAVG